MKRLGVLLLILWTAAAAFAEEKVHTQEIISKVYKIDQIYRSMKGPYGLQSFSLGQPGESELLWIVGYEAIVVEPEDGREISQEFMCHSNLDYRPKTYKNTLKGYPLDGRFFTLSQGQQVVEFPEGFGIPIQANEPLDLATQVLNLNDPELKKEVKFRIRVRYKRDSELEKPMVPLRQIGVQGLKSLTGEAAIFGVKKGQEHHGPSCSVGSSASQQNDTYDDALGQKFTGHWVVKPGREVNHTNITRYLHLTEDIDIHYVAVHLHPYAESLELRDLTEDKAVFTAKVTPTSDRVGIKHIDHYSSVEPLKLRKDHEYSLISVYNNTTGKDVDSMAVMYLYAAAKRFQSRTANSNF